MRDYREAAGLLRAVAIGLKVIDSDYARICDDAADVLDRIVPVMAEYRLQPIEAVMFPENAIKNELAGKILSELLKHPESYTLQRRDDPFMNDCVFRMTVDVLAVPPKEVRE